MSSQLEETSEVAMKDSCRSTSTPILHRPTIASVKTHTMGGSLKSYLDMKVHPDIQKNIWAHIIVEGIHERDPSKACISTDEKPGKPFNWQRPTTFKSEDDPETIRLQCFPGEDYVRHYAAITATYLSLKGKAPDSVRYTVPSPSSCLQPLRESNLEKMGQVDVAIVGYVNAFEKLAPGDWADNDDDKLFSWKTVQTRKGYRVAFLGCRICFWGDIGGNVVRVLQELNGVKCVIYVGKVGSLRPEHHPNQRLATGCQSYVDGELVIWKSPLEDLVRDSASVVRGVHCSFGSVLDETEDWLREARDRCDFVDPEIGKMAQASVAGGTQFGYLHVISDNLARKYEHDLSNERLDAVRDGRRKLLGEVEEVLGRFIDGWVPPEVD